jgi:hypothetical protein
MGPLTIQILIVVASFLFYRILRSGFDSWKTIIIDLGVVLFLFGLQQYLQRQNSVKDTEFPEPFSEFFKKTFGAKLDALENKYQISNRPDTGNGTGRGETSNGTGNGTGRGETSNGTSNGTYLEMEDSLFLEPRQRQTLRFIKKYEQGNLVSMVPNNQNGPHILSIEEDGFYMIQISCFVDTIPYYANLSIIGSKNRIEKSIHNGENNFVVHLIGSDKIYFEIENTKSKVMILENTSIYIIKL